MFDLGCGKTTFFLASSNQATSEQKWNLITDLVQLEMVINDGLKTLTAGDIAKVNIFQQSYLYEMHFIYFRPFTWVECIFYHPIFRVSFKVKREPID